MNGSWIAFGGFGGIEFLLGISEFVSFVGFLCRLFYGLFVLLIVARLLVLRRFTEFERFLCFVRYEWLVV